jgi:peptide/nickel transport system ATP-binding protein
MTTAQPILEVNALKKHFPVPEGLFGQRTRKIYAVDGVSFSINHGETFALVGESGCGKSTVGKAILRLFDITDGEIYLSGNRIDNLPAIRLRPLRQHMQIVFQDPYSSLNPRMRVRDILAEPLRNFGLARNRSELETQIEELLNQVKLPSDAANRFPHEFSGGQRQRLGIARALASRAKLIICDEAVSALDVSVKAQIVNLLEDLQVRLGVSLLFISHDLAIVEHIAHTVAVMYLGKIVELAPRRSLFQVPHHPYTKALLSAVPIPDPTNRRKRIILQGDVPSPANPPNGCRFSTRCPFVFERCRTEEPEFRRIGDDHFAACHIEP